MKLKVAIAQLSSVTGNLQENAKKIVDAIKKAKQQKADIVVFPELALSGQCFSHHLTNPVFVSENKRLIEEIAKQTSGIAAIVGYANGKSNSASIMQNGKIVLTSNKMVISSDEPFSAGETTQSALLHLKDGPMKIGAIIGEDLFDQTTTKKPARMLRQQGAELIFAIGNFSYSTSFEKRYAAARNQADVNGVLVVVVNGVGIQQHGHHITIVDGKSFYLDKQGNLGEILPACKEDLFIISIDTEKIITKPAQLLPDDKYSTTIFGLQHYAKSTNYQKAIVAVSGGIDSTVAAVIAIEAFGRQNVKLLHMPSQYTRQSSKDNAKQLAKNLGVKLVVDPITEAMDCFIASYHRAHEKIKNKATLHNIQARLRAAKLLAVANETNSLIIGSGNRTDIILNNTTLYGDHSIGVLPLGDISKKEIYEFVAIINKKKKIIPEAIIKTKPMHELDEESEEEFNYDIVFPLADALLYGETKTSLMQLFKEKKLQCHQAVYSLKPQQFSKLINDLSEKMHLYAYKHLQLPPMLTFTERQKYPALFDQWKE
ncbi:MAG: NAD(+) synthase [Candidatus Woesearchaeota archaeon]